MAAVKDIPGSGYGSAYIDSLVWGGKAWDPGKGPVKYLFGSRANFDAAAARHGNSLYLSDRADIQAWTAGEMRAFKTALALYAKVCGLTFAPARSAADADIVWWKTEIWTGSAGVHEIPDDKPVWGYFNPTDDWKNLQSGGDGRNTIMHEIGHGVGLAHPHDGGWEDDATRFPGVSSAHDTGRNGLNQGIWTVMSFNSGWSQRDHDATYGAQGALGALDIAALQAVYGPNPNTARGGNVYFLPTRKGSGTGWSCIWDAGGVDTISALHSHQGVTIDLRPATLRNNDPHAGGYVSAQSDIAGGFTIANGVTIENALGGTGKDFIKGNGAANRLRGLAGAISCKAMTGMTGWRVEPAGTPSPAAGDRTPSCSTRSWIARRMWTGSPTSAPARIRSASTTGSSDHCAPAFSTKTRFTTGRRLPTRRIVSSTTAGPAFFRTIPTDQVRGPRCRSPFSIPSSS